MNIELKQLSLENDITEYNMLQEIDANENGFMRRQLIEYNKIIWNKQLLF